MRLAGVRGGPKGVDLGGLSKPPAVRWRSRLEGVYFDGATDTGIKGRSRARMEQLAGTRNLCCTFPSASGIDL